MDETSSELVEGKGEHLLKINLSGGRSVDFYRDPETKDVKVCEEDYCAIIPQGSGMTTQALINLFSDNKEVVDGIDGIEPGIFGAESLPGY